VPVTDLAWVDGWQGPLSEARISIQDRGFLFGDGAYEMLRVYDGELFLMPQHLDRLEASLGGLFIGMPRPRHFVEALLQRLVDESGHRQARVYVQVTRGAARREHVFPRGVPPSLVVWVEEIHPVPEERRRNGVRVVCIADPRWNRCHLKALVLLPNVLARQEALESGASEALLIGPGGLVREGAGTNVFLVRGGQVWTPPLSPEILPGVTRAHVLQLARQDGIRTAERRFRLSTLLAADEVFLTSTTLEVLPVVDVDGARIGRGRPGTVTRRLQSLFEQSTRKIS
jgi:D-alanine transaminase